ncbi:hypothetical protein JVU11DRAFT_2882 [Chiua virens]|nr:hypothetical protein JVU11DRAFT_2882 [Chiua virens]
MGGFALHYVNGIKEIDIDEYLGHVQRGQMVNPVITEADIKDKSKSDALSKADLVVQLSWFTIQIIVRLVNILQ